MPPETKIRITTEADNKGAKSAEQGLKNLDRSGKQASAGAGRMAQAYARAGEKVSSALSKALGPITAIIGAIALARRGIQAWQQRQDALAEAMRKDIQSEYERSITAQAEAMERMARATAAEAEERNRRAQDLRAEIDLAEQAAQADLELRRAKALGSLDPDDDIARRRTETRFARERDELSASFGRQRTYADAELMREERAALAQQEAQNRQRLAALMATYQSQRKLLTQYQQKQLDDIEHDRTSIIARLRRYVTWTTMDTSEERAAKRTQPDIERIAGKPDDPKDRGALGEIVKQMQALREAEQKRAERQRQVENNLARIPQRRGIQNIRSEAQSATHDAAERDIANTESQRAEAQRRRQEAEALREAEQQRAERERQAERELAMFERGAHPSQAEARLATLRAGIARRENAPDAAAAEAAANKAIEASEQTMRSLMRLVEHLTRRQAELDAKINNLPVQ